jgi:NADH:ubiquinone oxidoreductase subunit 6 (subunit J)
VNPQLADLPTGVLVALVVVGIIQLTLDVIALVDLYRRPVDRVALGNKWVWVAIILLVNLLGAIIYLAAARKPAPATPVQLAPPSTSRSEGIADSLYGRRDTGPTGPDGAGSR